MRVSLHSLVSMDCVGAQVVIETVFRKTANMETAVLEIQARDDCVVDRYRERASRGDSQTGV